MILLAYVMMFSILPAAILAVVQYRRFALPDVRMLARFVIFSTVSDSILYALSVFHINTSILTGLHGVLELLIILLYFSSQGQFRKHRPIYMTILVLAALYTTLELWENPFIYPSKSKVTLSVIVVGISLYHAYRWLGSLLKPYEIFVILAFISYYTFNISAFLFANEMPEQILTMFWMMHDLMGIATNLLLLLALTNYLKRYAIRPYSTTLL